MISFSIIVALMLLAALVLVIRPLVKAPEDQQVEQEQVNLDIYQQKLAELETDLAEGQIEQQEYTAAQQDLEKQLIVDIPEQDAGGNIDNRRSQASLITLVIALPASALGLYLYLGTPTAINSVATQTQAASPHTGAVKPDQPMPSVAEMIVKIKQRLQENPEDAKGWNLLARSYMHTQQFEEAEQALEKLTTLVTDDPNIWANYADVAAVNQKGSLNGKPYELTKRALALEPKHPKALWLAGTYHYQQQSYDKAIRFWEILQGLLPPESKDADMINNSIVDARKQLGIVPTDQQPSAAPMAAAATSASVSGQVSLAAQLNDKVSPDDTVFVYARAASGPRMPLAVVKKQVKDLPFEFTLDDSMAMMPQMKLSNFESVVISARISKSGNAMTQSGDLVSNQPQVEVKGKPTVNLEIQQQVP